MAPHEARRSKKQPAAVAPLGADNLPAQPVRANSSSSNALAWMVVMLLMLAFSFCTVVLPRYGNGWVQKITTRVNLSMAPSAASSERAPVVAMTAAAPAVELAAKPSDGQPAAQQLQQQQQNEDQDQAMDDTNVDTQEETDPQDREGEGEQQQKQEIPPQEQQQLEGQGPAEEGEKAAAAAGESDPAPAPEPEPEPEPKELDAANAEADSPPSIDGQEHVGPDEAAAAAVDDAQDEDIAPEEEAKEQQEQAMIDKATEAAAEIEDEEAKRKAAELEAHKKRYQDALEEARNTPRAPPVDLSHIVLDADVEDPSNEPEPRLALVFTGQLKNVEPVHVANFTEQVLKPLLEYFNHVDVYLHSFNALTFNNPRNGEDHSPINVTRSVETIVAGLRAVEPAGKVKIKGILVTDPQDADASFKPLDYYLERGDPYNNEGLSLFNSLRAYHSLQTVTKLWQDKWARTTLEDGTERVDEYYQAVVYTRSDLIYFDKLQLIPQKWNETAKEFVFETKPDGSSDWTWDEVVRNNTLYTAPFDESYGLNDRFAYGRPAVMRLYGNRGQEIEAFFERYPDQSLWVEPFLHKVLIEMHDVQPGRIERFVFARVRATGFYGGTRPRRRLTSTAPCFDW